MTNLHCMWGHKGGIGKTWCAGTMLEYFTAQGRNCVGYDSDAANRKSALSAFKKLPVTLLDLVKDKAIDPTVFDQLIEDIAVSKGDSKEDTEVVIDIGASSHIEFDRFAYDSDLFNTLESVDVNCVIHTPIVNGDMYSECVTGIVTLARNFPTTPIIVWKNPVNGAVRSPQGNEFEQTNAYKQYAKHIKAIVDLPLATSGNFKKDFARKNQLHLTYEEVFVHSEFKLTQRSRLKRYWEDVKQTLSEAKL